MQLDRGVYAALLTPRDSEGMLGVEAFARQCQALAQTEVRGVAVNGATGEFPLTAEPELRQLLSIATAAFPGRAVLCGIGSGDVRGTAALGRTAIELGATALLLPMPSFFPYTQGDLSAYVSAVARALPAPILLYNLPQFTTGLATETILQLLRAHTNIIGIKDSSGSPDILRALIGAQQPAIRLVGNDSALASALAEGICDGVVSGVACILPRLLVSLFHQAPASPGHVRASALLSEFIQQIDALPTPWGLKVASEALGLAGGCFPFPLSPERAQQVAALQSWFAVWYASTTPMHHPLDPQSSKQAGAA